MIRTTLKRISVHQCGEWIRGKETDYLMVSWEIGFALESLGQSLSQKKVWTYVSRGSMNSAANHCTHTQDL